MMLTPERRAEIERYAQREIALPYSMARDLLAAHDFLLKAVRECEPEKHEGMYECAFCGNAGMPAGLINHKPDCPWLQAKEEK